MQIIDFEKKGNTVRFYLGDASKEYWGDDWNDAPYDVKHAHWIDMRLDDVHVCSHCDNVVVFMNGNEPVYCPYCGARMDEKDDE